ncbi:hypothetical protein DAMA08_020320 [Martiniozyma asiatica (nom. inval.)]|nr:hypothetical protein DAMA08_020320 [Martiniozyma asiatica]
MSLAVPRSPSVKIRSSFKRLFKIKRVQEEASNENVQESRPLARSPYEDEHKHILFQLAEADISVYKPIVHDRQLNSTSSTEDIHEIIKSQSARLVTQGKFHIYEMTTSKTKYMVCGDLVHPIFKSVHFIKINPSCYILPMSNPIRYWRIMLNTADMNILSQFELVLKDICHFKIDELNFTLDSPFTTMIEDEIEVRTFVHVDSDENEEENENNSKSVTDNNIDSENEKVLLRDLSTSTTAMDTTKTATTTTNTTPMGSAHIYQPTPIRASSTSESSRKSSILNLEKLSQSTNLTITQSIITLGQEFENDIDNDLEKISSTSSNENDLTHNFNHENVSINNSSFASGVSYANKYSLSFKSFDTSKPINFNVLDKYKDNIKDIIKEESKRHSFLF